MQESQPTQKSTKKPTR